MCEPNYSKCLITFPFLINCGSILFEISVDFKEKKGREREDRGRVNIDRRV